MKTDDALQKELAVVLDHLDALNQARQALPEAEHHWFDQALAGEGSIVDSAVQYTANLRGSGAIAQGPGAVAAGRGGVAIGGSVYGNVGDREEQLSPEDEEALRQGLEDIQRGDVRPWSEVKSARHPSHRADC